MLACMLACVLVEFVPDWAGRAQNLRVHTIVRFRVHDATELRLRLRLETTCFSSHAVAVMEGTPRQPFADVICLIVT